MSDTAAFFAKKKTKKKKFKSFNANKIDASAVTTQTHVDAPEISAAEDVTTSLGGLSGLGGSNGAGVEGISSGDDQWADTQGAWGSNNAATTNAAAGDSKVAELLDMQALNAKRNEQDDVRERLRIEETKAALAKAKEGMAKEAERLAAEKAEKEAKAAARASGMSGAGAGGPSAIGGGGGGSKWVPSRMRSAGVGFGMGGSNIRGPASMDGSSFQKPVDMANEELFPDLANADKILAEKEKQEKDEAERMAASQPVRAPTGWGSRMAPGGGSGVGGAPPARKPLNLAPPPAERKPLNLAPPPKKKEDESEAKEEKIEENKPAEAATPAESAPAATVTPDVAATPAPETDKPKEKKVLKKKKKKDLSTFKPKS